MRWAKVVGVLSAVIWLVLAGTAQAQTPATRPAIPGQADLAAATKTIYEVYADDFKNSKKPAELLALSRKLQSAARDEKDDPSCFALLLKARDLGIQAGSFDQTTGVIDSMRQRFGLDVLVIKWDAALAVARTATADQRIELGTGVKQLAMDALREDRYDIAVPAAELYADIVDGDLLVEARILITRIHETQTGYDMSKSALATLRLDPTNPDANFMVGEFECFYKGDWSGGLPMLAIGSDPVLKDLAAREMGNPAAPVDVMKLADGWWDLGKDETGIVHAEILFHAGQLYSRAGPGLTGMDKAKADARCKRAMALHDLTSGSPASVLTNSIGMNFVRIHPGTFLMGSPDTENGRGPNETQHKVTLTKGFLMGTAPVTVGQYAMFVNETGYQTLSEVRGYGFYPNENDPKQVKGASWKKPGFEQEAENPVVEVTWNDAVAFCEWLSKKEGKTYRLPTEAEWEYSARAGTQTTYFFGDDVGMADEFTWNVDNAGHKTYPAGEKRPNPWGLYDMGGNVYQWCSDIYMDYSAADVTDPTGATNGTDHVRRGSSWANGADNCRCTARFGRPDSWRVNNVGFRVVMDAAESDAGIAGPLPAGPDGAGVLPGKTPLPSRSSVTVINIPTGQLTLDNKTDAAEGDEVLSRVTANYPRMVKGYAGARLVEYRDGIADPHGDDNTVKTLAGSYAKNAMYTDRNGNPAIWGFMDSTLDPGKYMIVYRVQRLSTATGVDVMGLEFKTRGGARIGDYDANGDEFTDNQWSEIPLSVDLKETSKTRYQIWANGHGMALDRVYVFELTNDVVTPPARGTGAPTSSTVTNSIGMKLVHIAPGMFLMGSPANESTRSDHEPLHKVTLTKGFYLESTPLTQAQWNAIEGSNPSHFRGDDLPVDSVLWSEAKEYCNALSEKEGKHYRLPSEAEWEYACRAGTQTAYYYGNDPALAGDYFWFRDNSGKSTHPVGQKKPNAWGLYDMGGEIWNWCADGFSPLSTDAAVDPRVKFQNNGRVIRGGTWDGNAGDCRSANRWHPSDGRHDDIGFRVMMDDDAGMASAPSDNHPAPIQPTSGTGAAGSWPVTNSIGMKLVCIEPGKFWMGSPPNEAHRRDNEPLHQVTLTKAFYMGATSVTQAQWDAIMTSDPSPVRIRGVDMPVTRVLASEAKAFCKILSDKEGKHYRLPTEAEWEYACRAGTKTAYYFGDDLNLADDFIWARANGGMAIRPVGEKKPNPWGLYDMGGNVWNRCEDGFSALSDNTATDPCIRGSSDVIRGASGGHPMPDCRSAFREHQETRQDDIGFRVVMDDDAGTASPPSTIPPAPLPPPSPVGGTDQPGPSGGAIPPPGKSIFDDSGSNPPPPSK